MGSTHIVVVIVLIRFWVPIFACYRQTYLYTRFGTTTSTATPCLANRHGQ